MTLTQVFQVNWSVRYGTKYCKSDMTIINTDRSFPVFGKILNFFSKMDSIFLWGIFCVKYFYQTSQFYFDFHRVVKICKYFTGWITFHLILTHFSSHISFFLDHTVISKLKRTLQPQNLETRHLAFCEKFHISFILHTFNYLVCSRGYIVLFRVFFI